MRRSCAGAWLRCARHRSADPRLRGRWPVRRPCRRCRCTRQHLHLLQAPGSRQRAAGVAGEHFEGQRLQGIARQHCGTFVKRLVAGRLAAAQVVVVHGWQVVVDQAVGVDHLDGDGGHRPAVRAPRPAPSLLHTPARAAAACHRPACCSAWRKAGAGCPDRAVPAARELALRALAQVAMRAARERAFSHRHPATVHRRVGLPPSFDRISTRCFAAAARVWQRRVRATPCSNSASDSASGNRRGSSLVISVSSSSNDFSKSGVSSLLPCDSSRASVAQDGAGLGA